MLYSMPSKLKEFNEWDAVELERYREEESRRIDEEVDARHRREREAKERHEMSLRSAQGWREALSNQAVLFQREANFDIEIEDDFFGPGADACRQALKLWPEVEGEYAPKIAELQAKIEALRSEMISEIGKRLLEEDNEESGWKDVAQILIDNEENDPEAWLNW